MDKIIFYKLATLKESRSQCSKNNVFKSMPDKYGYIKVYMHFGFKGRGFYYQKEHL